MPLSNPPAGAVLTVAETQVFNGAAPTAWTDLDLSATIGSQSTLVLIKFKGDGTQQIVAVRQNGDTDEFYETAAEGYNSGTVQAKGVAGHKVLLVATDSTGKIEWKANNTDVTTIDVISYIK